MQVFEGRAEAKIILFLREAGRMLATGLPFPWLLLTYTLRRDPPSIWASFVGASFWGACPVSD